MAEEKEDEGPIRQEILLKESLFRSEKKYTEEKKRLEAELKKGNALLEKAKNERKGYAIDLELYIGGIRKLIGQNEREHREALERHKAAEDDMRGREVEIILSKYPELKKRIDDEVARKNDRETKDINTVATTIKVFTEKIGEINRRNTRTETDRKALAECRKVVDLYTGTLERAEGIARRGETPKSEPLRMEPVEIAAMEPGGRAKGGGREYAISSDEIPAQKTIRMSELKVAEKSPREKGPVGADKKGAKKAAAAEKERI